MIASAPLASLARTLRRKFRRGAGVETSGAVGSRRDGVVLHAGGTWRAGDRCATVSTTTTAIYPARRAIEVPMEGLENVHGVKWVSSRSKSKAMSRPCWMAQSRPSGAAGCACRIEVDERLSPADVTAPRPISPPWLTAAFRLQGTHRADRAPLDRGIPATVESAGSHRAVRPATTLRTPSVHFIFLPPREPPATLERMSQQLKRL